MLDLVMDGTITAESDISISPPDHTKKEGRSTFLTLPEKRVWRGADLVTTVYIPGSAIRGALRNGAARAYAEARSARQAPMTPDDYMLIAKGGIKDRKEAGKDERVVDHASAAALRQREPIVSLFGAMAMKIVGRWQIGDAVPDEPTTPNRKGRSVRSHPFQRQPDLGNFMDEVAYKEFLERDRKIVEANLREDEIERLRSRILGEKRRPEPNVDRIEQWEEEATRLQEEMDELRAQAGGAVNVQQLFGGWQAIPEGTRMVHRMRIRNVTEDELAWALFALRRLARDGRLGAHESHGEGYFSAEYTLCMAEHGGDFRDAGRLRIAEFCVSLESDIPILKSTFEKSAKILNERSGNAA